MLNLCLWFHLVHRCRLHAQICCNLFCLSCFLPNIDYRKLLVTGHDGSKYVRCGWIKDTLQQGMKEKMNCYTLIAFLSEEGRKNAYMIHATLLEWQISPVTSTARQEVHQSHLEVLTVLLVAAALHGPPLHPHHHHHLVPGPETKRINPSKYLNITIKCVCVRACVHACPSTYKYV